MIDDRNVPLPEEEDDEEGQTWQTTFADLTTLLLVFFVLLYSMSSIDTGKYMASFASIKAALTNARGGAIKVHNDQGGVFLNEIKQYRQIIAGQKTNFTMFQQFSTEHGIEGIVGANLESGTITLKVPADTFFAPGSTKLTQEARRIITILKDYFSIHHDLKINIKGHTDTSRPSASSRWRDNWELSSLRAVAVLRFLLHMGMEPNRVTATGMGSFQPAYPNTTPENKAKNRRVEFVLEKIIRGDGP
ncbi:OmpA/MotB family protein [Desulfoplanes sp.]